MVASSLKILRMTAFNTSKYAVRPGAYGKLYLSRWPVMKFTHGGNRNREFALPCKRCFFDAVNIFSNGSEHV
jgi:hypothetical protein